MRKPPHLSMQSIGVYIGFVLKKYLWKPCFGVRNVLFRKLSSHNRKWVETVLLLEKYSLNLNKYGWKNSKRYLYCILCKDFPHEESGWCPKNPQDNAVWNSHIWDIKLFLLVVENILKTSVTNKVLYPKHHGLSCIWRQGFSWGRFLNFDSICLSFWVITKTRRLVVSFHLWYYAHVLVCVSVVVFKKIHVTQFRKLIFKTTARFFQL